MTSALSAEALTIGQDLELDAAQVARTIELLDEGNTIPFITRYRRHWTGGLDEERIRAIKEARDRCRALAERKGTILKSIEAQGKLTDELRLAIEQARTIKRLEDLYLPFKPKKQTLATLARQRGLEPLAVELLEGRHGTEALAEAALAMVRVDRGLNSVEEVYQGIGHLIAERFGEDIELRSALRRLIWRTGRVTTTGIVPAPANEATGERTEVQQKGSEELPESNSPETMDLSVEAAVPEEIGNAAGEAVAPATTTASEDGGGAAATSPIPEASRGAEGGQGKRRRRKSKPAKKDEKDAFSDYFSFSESLEKLPPHRVLAINRGERAKAIRVRISFDEAAALEEGRRRRVPDDHPQREWLIGWMRDALTRLMVPSLEREIRRELTERAETHAVSVFARNLRNLLLQPPIRGRRVLAVDPGYKSGCKIAVLDEMGSLLESHVVFVVGNAERRRQGREWLVNAIKRYGVSVVAIGNGTASREVETLVAELLEHELQGSGVAYVMVNEAGASVYSTSPAGREELPKLDPTVRSSLSIGRRLLDPLSELVKISPENLGVGLYQHDVKAKHLRESLDDVVASCVNFVGVDANTASPALLRYVSGLNQLSAKRFVEYRTEHGPFQTRRQFSEVPGFGEATFVQAAGFLKIPAGEHPLDATWIHPESYDLTERLIERLGFSLREIGPFLGRGVEGAAQEGAEASASSEASDSSETSASSEPSASSEASAESVSETPATNTDVWRRFEESIAAADVEALARELGAGSLLLRDILADLRRPGRDPRESLPPVVLRTGATRIDDLEPGMELPGRVLNVVDFGVFVDIGLSESGLVHISRLSRDFVKDPHQRFAVGQPIRVWVVSVDKQRRRVSLTAIDPNAPEPQERRRPPQSRPRREGQRPDRPAQGERPAGTGSEPRRGNERGRVGQPGGRGPGGGRQDRGPGPGKRPQREFRATRPSRPAPPPPPLRPEVEEGKEPMRSFTELMQFYRRKKEDQ